uniref:Putative camp-dependent protein kinase inhibitor beta n=1 Tax=Ornithodoros turicata TaxID=34597 RepID=A0A2R5LNH7_9ACAR
MEVEQQPVDPNKAANFDAFLQTGRTGRRNALPDILEEGANVSTASLPCSFEKLSCSDSASTSAGGASPGTTPSTSGQTNS